MFVAASRSSEANRAAAASLEPVRARGGVSVAFKAVGDGRSRLADLHEWGGYRAKLPRTSGMPEAVLINTGGGLLGGDSVRFDAAVAKGAAAQVTTQSAERVYRSLGPDCRIAVQLTLAAGACLHWLPQETILFNEARLVRTITAEVPPDASLLVAEAVVFGRTASDETVVSGALRDVWRISRNGVLLYADNVRLAGDIQAALGRSSIGAGAKAMATVVYVSADAADRVDAARAALASPRGRAAVSAWNGMLVGRLLAPSADALKADVASLAACLGGQPLPRVWGLLQ